MALSANDVLASDPQTPDGDISSPTLNHSSEILGSGLDGLNRSAMEQSREIWFSLVCQYLLA